MLNFDEGTIVRLKSSTTKLDDKLYLISRYIEEKYGFETQPNCFILSEAEGKNTSISNKQPLSTSRIFTFDSEMGKNKKRSNSLGDLGGMVYSTNPDYDYNDDEKEEEVTSSGNETLYVSRDKKSRGGKVATLVEGFEGNDAELTELGKWLKQQCGVGGSAKNGEIIVQGDKRDRVAELLKGKGYKVKLKGG